MRILEKLGFGNHEVHPELVAFEGFPYLVPANFRDSLGGMVMAAGSRDRIPDDTNIREQIVSEAERLYKQHGIDFPDDYSSELDTLLT